MLGECLTLRAGCWRGPATRPRARALREAIEIYAGMGDDARSAPAGC
jgi:hypothetical protein